MGLEARLEGLKKSELFKKFSSLEKDALYLYNAMKRYCYRKGHIYLEQMKDIVHNSYQLMNLVKGPENYVLKNSVEKVLDFLEDNGVLVAESDGDPKVRYFLADFHRDEVRICEKINGLLELQDPDLQLELNFEDPEWEKIRTDDKQMEAASMCAQKPVVMISGRGGTGKTEIVSAIVHILERTLIEKNPPLKTHDNRDEKKERMRYPEPKYVLCVAPTGKAGTGLAQRSGIQGTFMPR